ncbi:hypothetical protein [Nocardioides sp. NPDC006303]|uniref:hypothetical protein n=1 Tax=Nocardioides sp. NPDC006303 TaxID=3156747 RepID=UPI0033A3F40D
MTNEIELIGDDDGVVVVGGTSALERFLDHVDLRSHAEQFDLARVSGVLKSGADLAETAAGIAEQSALYLKLTPESAKKIQEAGGLMKTKTKGVSHAMVGETGKNSLKWIQVEDGPTSLLTNPAVLSGVGGIMTQLAQQSEAQELKELFERIDEKLDDVRRAQRDHVLAKMDAAAEAIEEAMTIHHHGGDPETLWGKVSGASKTLHEVQNEALRALGALAEKIEEKSKPGELMKATREVEREVAIQLAVLARCFELQDEFSVIELDHVLATSPKRLDGHRRGVRKAREVRRAKVLKHTEGLMSQMDRAGTVAMEHVLLHAAAARGVINSLNATATVVDDFHAPLGINMERDELTSMRWTEAVRDPRQLKKAGLEVGQKAAMVGGAAAVAALSVVTVRSTSNRDS